MSRHPNPHKMADDIGEDARALVSLLEDATAVQFDPSRKAKIVGDPGIRSKGGVSDPTGETAIDPIRLALRSNVQAAAKALVTSHADLYGRRLQLERSLEAWRGDGTVGK